MSICFKEFLSRAREVHGEQYEYDESSYKNISSKIKIYCSKHGDFEQIPYVHIKGSGCPKCASESYNESAKKGIDKFTEEANIVHNFKYDYSESNYTNNKTKIKIICPNHGEFYVSPCNHLKGTGCQECRIEESLKNRQNDFIQKCKTIHNNKYDYSKTIYKESFEEICITCPKHGDFYQKPYIHSSGHGCPKCSIEKRLQNKIDEQKKQEIINKIKEIHKDKYTYEKLDFQNKKDEVIVTCPKHGDFNILLKDLLRGVGCKKCANVYHYTTQEYIEKAKEIHGNKYDYSEVNYTQAQKKIKIICNKKDKNNEIHGPFWQKAYVHLGGCGCVKCSYEQRREKTMLDQEDFIKKSNEIHDNKYDYSKVCYKGNKRKVIITCPKHGDFLQTPNLHSKGAGCPKCKRSKLQIEVEKKLTNEGIEFEAEKQFEWLKCKRKLKLDIYIPLYNIAIECQGEQHFFPISFGSKKEKEIQDRFIKTQEYDIIKKQMCEKHNIPIIYYGRKKYNDCIITDLDILIKTIKNQQ